MKRYASEKVRDDDSDWRHAHVTLSPTNREYSPIVLTEKDAGAVQVVGEFVAVLRG